MVKISLTLVRNIKVLDADYKPNHFHALFKLNVNTPEVLITGMHTTSIAAERSQYWIDLTNDLSPFWDSMTGGG